MTGETKLDHNDRIVVGSTHIWIFQNPLEKGIDKKHYPPITYEYAQEEIAAKAGINIQVLISMYWISSLIKYNTFLKHINPPKIWKLRQMIDIKAVTQCLCHRLHSNIWKIIDML